jgi:serine/threonine-protein kinase PknG
VEGDTLEWQHLPALKVDPGDPMASWLSTLSVTEPEARMQALFQAPQETVEVRLDLARTAIAAGRRDVADGAVAQVLREDAWEWRAVWVSGLAALADDDAPGARSSFNAVYGQVPGELAAKLALAVACERSDALDVAASLYMVCARTDANYTAPAAFGLTRIREARGDVDGALAALDLVPSTSRAYVEARRQRARLLAASGRGLSALSDALGSIESVTIDPLDRARLRTDVLQSALDIVQKQGPQESVKIAGVPAADRQLRDALERAYRDLAALTPAGEERVALVDQANTVRRWTWR